MATPTYFASAADFRSWLAANHEIADELLVGFWKKGTGRPSIDWPEARDQALCFGWIDGIRKSLGPDSYTIRFTPRRKGSTWSKVNLGRYEALTASGEMTDAGVCAFEANQGRSAYSYERPVAASLTAEDEKLIRADEAAWADWQKRPPGYRKLIAYWITSAKKPETRARRLAALIQACAEGRKVAAADVGGKK